MFKKFKIEDDELVVSLCTIFHRTLTEYEIMTGVAKLRFGKYTIKQMVSNPSYGIWYNNRHIMIIYDGAGHTFSVGVHENSFITPNMATVILKCMITVFKNSQVTTFAQTKDRAIDTVHNIIHDAADHISSDDVSDLSEMLYGDDNSKQFKEEYEE